MKKLYNRNRELEEFCQLKDKEIEKLQKRIEDLEDKDDSDRENDFDIYRFNLDSK